MAEPMDERLSKLGKGVPFPVDWNAYEQNLIARLASAQRVQRKKTWFAALAGTLAGAAAMFVAALHFIEPSAPAMPQSRQTEIRAITPQEKHPVMQDTDKGGDNNLVYVVGTAGGGRGIMQFHGQADQQGSVIHETGSSTRMVYGKDGSVSRITSVATSATEKPDLLFMPSRRRQ